MAKEFENLLPQATLVLLPKCGHAPMMEKVKPLVPACCSIHLLV